LPEAYLALAQDYQRRTDLFPGWRELLVQRLAPRRGDTVLDLCCGSGLNLAALRYAVGPRGTVIAVEEPPELLAVAATLVTRRGWDNVELINASIEGVRLSVQADAALLCAAPKALASPMALLNVFAHLIPGAGVAAGGWKWPSIWLWPLRPAVTAWQRPVVTDFAEFDQPWRLLAEHAPLHISEIGFGAGYLAHHTRRPVDRHRGQ
jgi:demethylmenaquinone methyltransferase/2-methoxy-6-polyprenyl-1,4-benzoquinol methylase